MSPPPAPRPTPRPPPATPPVDGVALARLYGEPLFRMPTDLYIPPDALEVFLETFEGPLDLLLYLIRRQNFNIFDIPLAQVTRQYLDYVDQIRQHNLELASEYLLMAAMLIEIKSRMLLPPKPTADGAEPEDPRAELVRRLLEYEQMKLAAAQLDALPVIGRDFLRAQVTMEQSNVTVFPDVEPGRPARGLGRHPQAGQAEPAPPHLARAAVGARVHDQDAAAPAGRALRRVPGAVRDSDEPDRDGGDVHRDARALARAPARGDAGRGLRADLRAARVLAAAMTSPRPPLRLAGAPPNRQGEDGEAADSGFDAVDHAPHDLHPPYRELAVVDNETPADEDAPRTALSPRFAIAALIVFQALAASTYLDKYIALAHGEDQYRFAAALSVVAARACTSARCCSRCAPVAGAPCSSPRRPGSACRCPPGASATAGAGQSRSADARARGCLVRARRGAPDDGARRPTLNRLLLPEDSFHASCRPVDPAADPPDRRGLPASPRRDVATMPHADLAGTHVAVNDDRIDTFRVLTDRRPPTCCPVRPSRPS